MEYIDLEDVQAGDTIELESVSPSGNTSSIINFTVAETNAGFSSASYKTIFKDNEGNSLYVPADWSVTVKLIDRPDPKRKLARQMLDMYNDTEGNRMVRMHRLVRELDLISQA